MTDQENTLKLPWPPNAMSGADFQAWIDHMNYTKKGAARILGISRNSVDRYLKNGPPVTVALACAALAYGLPPWRKP